MCSTVECSPINQICGDIICRDFHFVTIKQRISGFKWGTHTKDLKDQVEPSVQLLQPRIVQNGYSFTLKPSVEAQFHTRWFEYRIHISWFNFCCILQQNGSFHFQLLYKVSKIHISRGRIYFSWYEERLIETLVVHIWGALGLAIG